MKTQILSIFTRTPMHIGTGSSVGAIDLPVVRERATKFPVIPGTSLKGVVVDLWTELGKSRGAEATWLFGAEAATEAAAGALLIGEGRLLAFPVRSAKGAFAWITCPLALHRYARDAGKPALVLSPLTDTDCLAVPDLKLDGGKIVLEEYAFTVKGDSPAAVRELLAPLVPNDPVWSLLPQHLVVLTDGLFSFFVENACAVATHVRINDATGTAAKGGLFNQEQVPSECLFYSVLALRAGKGAAKDKTADAAGQAFVDRLAANHGLLQLGSNESTGLGWCTVTLL